MGLFSFGRGSAKPSLFGSRGQAEPCDGDADTSDKFLADKFLGGGHGGKAHGFGTPVGGGQFDQHDDDTDHDKDHDRDHHGDKSRHDRDDDDRDACGEEGSEDGGGENGGGENGGGASSVFPAIPADTTGVTFHVDLNGDGVNDEYAVVKAPDGVDPATLTLQDYYDIVVGDLQASHPDLAANQIVVKATIYSASQGESYYQFTGNETTSDTQTGPEDEDDHDENGDSDGDQQGHSDDEDGDDSDEDDHDDNGDDSDEDDHGDDGDDSNEDDHEDDDHEDDHGDEDGHDDADRDDHDDDSCGDAEAEQHSTDNGSDSDDDSAFYSGLMSCEAGSLDDETRVEDEDEPASQDDLLFC